MLKLSSSAWEQKQAGLASSGERRSFIILEAALGQDLDNCMSDLLQIIHEEVQGLILPDELVVNCKYRALRFCVSSASLCVIHALLRLCRSNTQYQMSACSRTQTVQMSYSVCQIAWWTHCSMKSKDDSLAGMGFKMRSALQF